MPELFAESQASAVKLLAPQILPLIDELTKQEINSVAPPKPVKRTN